MHWTPQLNALLNQCVFASGYDFEASSELFCQQASKLHLWTGDELVLTANQCQEQWMLLNPTEEDDEDKDEAPETDVNGHQEQLNPQRDVDDAKQAVVDEDESVAVPEGGPRLELSLSDAELDQLLSTLPPSETSDGDGTTASADAKQPSSEMQWVLAFLTDPHAIASVDVEAKNMMGSPEKHDDDNYQVFLQDLQNANLMAPAPTSIKQRQSKAEADTSSKIDDDDDDSSDESEKEWERTRQAMKNSMKLR